MIDAAGTPNPGAPPLLRVNGLRKQYLRGGPWTGVQARVESLRGIDLELRSGASVALIGASGSGKSTLARCLASLESPDSGDIWFEGAKLPALGSSTLPRLRRQVQMVFQDPALSLNPRFSAAEIVSEPLLIAGIGTKSERTRRAVELMTLVGLPPDSGGRRPHEFSGGQRRRLAIARALAVEPKVLILDEALAGLDLSTQAQIANLLLELQRVRSLTYLWISHDLRAVARLTGEVAVIDEGKIVERASTREFFAHPQSRPARVLVEAARAPQPGPAS